MFFERTRDGARRSDEGPREEPATTRLPVRPVPERGASAPVAAALTVGSTRIARAATTAPKVTVTPDPGRGATIRREIELASIQIDVNPADGTIVNSRIATNARGEGSIRGEEGSHTSPWVLTVEGFRSTLQGKTVQQAVAAVDTVYAAAIALPGAQPARVAALSTDRRDALTEARDILTRNRNAARGGPTLDLLQEYVSALMTFRNMLPLTAAKRGSPANPNAEDLAMQVIRDATNRQAREVRLAIFALADRKAIEDYQTRVEFEQDPGHMTAEVSFDHPGAIDTQADAYLRVLEIVQQHLAWVKALFPAAYNRAAITEATVRDELLFPGRGADLGRPQDYPAIGPHVPGAAAHAPVHARPPAGGRFSTQVVLDDTTPGLVASLIVSGRPPGVFGGQDRKHTTSWAVFERAVRAKVETHALGDGIRGVRDLFTEAKVLPGAQAGRVQAMSDPATARFTTARTDADNAQTAALNSLAVNDFQVQQGALQGFINAFLRYRNAMPLTAAVIPTQLSTTGGKSEGTSLATLDGFEGAGRLVRTKNKALALAAFWKLLDFGALDVVAKPSWPAAPQDTNRANVTYETNVPGIAAADKKSTRLNDIIVQHVRTMTSAYPNSVSFLQADISASFDKKIKPYFIDRTKVQSVAALIRATLRWPKLKRAA